MDNLEKELHRLAKIEPSPKFCREAKGRLMHKIILDRNEKWFLRLFRKVFSITPSPYFIQTARIRLLERIEALKRPIIGWWVFTKRIVASTLVMVIAVTTTLFFIDGKQEVMASENTYLEVFEGEVAVKHADRLIWDTISTQTELSVGDLIRLEDSASAVIHFFDDSEMRLADDSLLMLSQLDPSPGYARQGVIEVSLHQGRAWVQTLNAYDGYTAFTLITPDAIVSTHHASFDIQTNSSELTQIRVFNRSVDVRALRQESREVFANGKLNSYQKIMLKAASPYQPLSELVAFAPITDLTEADRNEEWVLKNMESDSSHLAKLRERELINLRAATGTLPGEILYPIKRAKERLSLALSFKEESQANAQIDMANQRLNESIVLIEQGEMENAKLALMEYQDLVRQIAENNTAETADLGQLSNRIVTTHQKTLVAALPGDAQIGIVKQILDQTEELFAESSMERAEIRLQNSLEDLTHVQDLIVAGNLEDAQEVLENYEILTSDTLEKVSQFENDEQKKTLYSQILDIQHEERRVLSEIARKLSSQKTDSPLISLVENADSNLASEIKRTAAVIRPLLPDVILSQAVMLPIDEKVYEFVEKVNIYKTFQGQKNQISRLLTKHPQYARDMEFLVKLRNKLDFRAKDEISRHIFELKRLLIQDKDRQMRQKIERAKRLLRNR